MRASPSIATGLPDDVDVYLMLDDFGERLGHAWRETNDDRTDRETVIADLMDSLYRAREDRGIQHGRRLVT
jgi:hypothetical protein